MLIEKILESNHPPAVAGVVVSAPNAGFLRLSSCLERSLSFHDFTLLRLKSGGQNFHTQALAGFEGGTNGTLITCLKKGTITLQDGLKHKKSDAGDILITSLDDNTTFIGNFEANGLMIANSRLARHGIAAPHAAVEQIRDSGISTRLLHLQISELLTASSVLSSEEAQALLSPTLTLLKAVRTLASKANQPAENLALARVKAFIKENLSDADLSIEMISDSLGMSRATLYRVAEPLGGVRKYIRTQRLKLAHAKLLAGEESAQSITNLAFDLGFGTETAFRRAFKEAFGMPPSQMNPSTKSAH